MKLILLLLFAFVVTSKSASVTLAWFPNPETNLVQYRVYSGTASRNYQGFQSSSTNLNYGGTNLLLTVTNLAPSMRYYFALTAVNVFTNESGFSAEVSTNTPITIPQGFRVITNSLDGAESPAGPWLEITNQLVMVSTTNDRMRFFRGRVGF